MWDVLGIEPTDDEKRIKHAYAVRLRTLDVDKDIAAFQRLRQAYEQALLYARRKAGPRPEMPVASAVDDGPAAKGTETTGDSTPMGRPPARINAVISRQESDTDDFFGELNAHLESKDTKAALALLDSALARGVLSIVQRANATNMIMTVVVHDKSMRPDQFDAIMKRVGWNTIRARGEAWSRTREAAMKRMDANSWFREMRTFARDSFWRPSSEISRKNLSAYDRQAQRRTARMLVRGRWPIVRFSKIGANDLQAKVVQCLFYREFLEGQMNAGAFRCAETALTIEKHWGRLLRFSPVLVLFSLIAFVLCTGVLALVLVPVLGMLPGTVRAAVAPLIASLLFVTFFFCRVIFTYVFA